MSNTCSNCFSSIPEGTDVCPVCGYSSNINSGKYPMALPAGTVLNGRYILGRVLGQGGFGITYLAKDHKTGNLVAVKEYFPDTFAARTYEKTVYAYTEQRMENFLYGKKCFLNEAKTLAEFIGNPNIVRVYSYFEENNTAYFVMDYVQGISLRDYLKKYGRISWEKAKSLLFPIMDALSQVHSRGIIHRDVTPDNIYITKDGMVKLLDFGAARYSLGDRSRSIDVVLKHGFAPREQYSRHGRQGPYTDVYALAATYYFSVTGRLPPDSIDRQEHDDLILPSSLGVKISQNDEDALCKGLEVSAADRFQTMNEFKQALEPPNPNIQKNDNDSSLSDTENNNGILIPKYDNNDTTINEPINQPDIVIKPEDINIKTDKKRKIKAKTAAIAACSVVLCISLVTAVLAVVLNTGGDTDRIDEEKPVIQDYNFNQETEPSEETEKIPDGMKKESLMVRQTDFNYEGEISEITRFSYDAWGNTIQNAVYDENGSLEKYKEYTYDKNGNKIQDKTFDSTGEIDYWYLYEYDEKGNVVVTKSLDNSGKLMEWNEASYDTEGTLLRKDYFNKDGVLNGWSSYSYDKKGNLIKNESFDQDGNASGRIEYTYDDSGALIIEAYYESDDNLSTLYVYEYDEDGNRSEWSDYNVDGIADYKHKFDKDGNELEFIAFEDNGDISVWVSYEYNSYGDPICKIFYEVDGTEDFRIIYEYEKEYDEEDRLIKETAYEDGDIMYIKEYEVCEIFQEAGGNPNLEVKGPFSSEGGSEVETTGAAASIPSDTNNIGSSVIMVIDYIEGLDGFVTSSAGVTRGAVVEVDGGQCFMSMYVMEPSKDKYTINMSLYDFRGNGIVQLADNKELFLYAGGNNGKIGLVTDKQGNCYYMENKSYSRGDVAYTDITYIPWDKNGLDETSKITVSYENNFDNGDEAYFIDGSEESKQTFEDFQSEFTAVCILDLFDGSAGEVMTFKELRDKYE